MIIASLIPADFAGTLPGWITAICSATMLGVLLKFYIGHRTLNLKANEVKLSGLKIEQDGDEKLRSHWLAEVESLRAQLSRVAKDHRDDVKQTEDRYQGMMKDAEDRFQRLVKEAEDRHQLLTKEAEDRHRLLAQEAEDRHEACLKDRDLLKEQVNALKDEITGLIRLIAQNSVNKVLDVSSKDGPLPMGLSQEVVDAAERVEKLFAEPKPEGQEDGTS